MFFRGGIVGFLIGLGSAGKLLFVLAFMRIINLELISSMYLDHIERQVTE